MLYLLRTATKFHYICGLHRDPTGVPRSFSGMMGWDRMGWNGMGLVKVEGWGVAPIYNTMEEASIP
jgi:hypothetical protein